MQPLALMPMIAGLAVVGTTVVGTTVTQLNADALYLSLGLVLSLCGAVFYVGRKLSEIDLGQKEAQESRKELREEMCKVTDELRRLHDRLITIEGVVSRLPCVSGKTMTCK